MVFSFEINQVNEDLKKTAGVKNQELENITVVSSTEINGFLYFYMNERLPATNGLIWVPEGHIPEFILDENCPLNVFMNLTDRDLTKRDLTD